MPFDSDSLASKAAKVVDGKSEKDHKHPASVPGIDLNFLETDANLCDPVSLERLKIGPLFVTPAGRTYNPDTVSRLSRDPYSRKKLTPDNVHRNLWVEQVLPYINNLTAEVSTERARLAKVEEENAELKRKTDALEREVREAKNQLYLSSARAIAAGMEANELRKQNAELNSRLPENTLSRTMTREYGSRFPADQNKVPASSSSSSNRHRFSTLSDNKHPMVKKDEAASLQKDTDAAINLYLPRLSEKYPWDTHDIIARRRAQILLKLRDQLIELSSKMNSIQKAEYAKTVASLLIKRLRNTEVEAIYQRISPLVAIDLNALRKTGSYLPVISQSDSTTRPLPRARTMRF